MGSLKQGAEQMIRVCLDLKQKEKLVIMSERSKTAIVDAIVSEAKSITDAVVVCYLDDYGPRPLSVLPDAVKAAVENSDVSMMLLDKMKGELSSVRRPLKELGMEHGRCVICPNINEDVMRQGMSVDHIKVREFTSKVYELLDGCKEIKINTSLGTDLTLTFKKRYRWMKSDGDYRKRPQNGTNLPGAEVFTYPADVNGVVYIDGILGDYFTSKFGFLDKTPVRLEIKDGRVTKIDCSDEKLKNEFSEYVFDSDDNSSRIGEIGIGTNKYIKRLIGLMLQDEKYPGVHLAVGHGYPKWTGAPYDSAVHCDGVITKATVLVDGKELLHEGVFTI